MQTFQKFLIVLGAFVFAYNASTIVHECGHALTAEATGGTVGRIRISPLSWSYTHLASNPEPRAVSWGGFLLQSICGVLVCLMLWCLKSRLSLWGTVLAMTSLAYAGFYMVGGTVARIGDADALIRMGVSPTTLIVIGGALILLSLPFALPLGTLLGTGRGNARFPTTLLVMSPVLAYLMGVVSYNVVTEPREWLFWACAGGGGILLVFLLSILVHWSAAWVKGAESQRRAAPVNWLTVVLSLLFAAGIVVGEVIVFPQ